MHEAKQLGACAATRRLCRVELILSERSIRSHKLFASATKSLSALLMSLCDTMFHSLSH